MSRSDRHSRIVGWLKVALPLTALALLSTLFLLADRIDPTDAIRYADVDVEALARDPRMTAPTYAGTTTDGSALTLTASAARPASASQSAAAEDVTLRLDMPGGGNARMRADEAVIDTAAGELRLAGNVKIDTSSGYQVETDALSALLDRTGAESPGKVHATAPGVSIDAGRFSLSHGAPPPAPPATTGSETETETGTAAEPGTAAPGKTATQPATPYLLVFSGGVQMVYQPGG